MKAKTVSLAVVLAVGLIAGTGGAAMAAPSSHTSTEALTPSAVARASTADLVRALYFGQGDAARELESLPGFTYLSDFTSQTLDQDQISAINDIVGRMEAVDPVRFQAAADKLRSGDPYVVEQEIAALNDVFMAVMSAAADDDSAQRADSGARSPVVVIAVVFHAAAAVTGVVVAAMAVAVAGAVLWHAEVAVTNRAGVPGGKERFLADMTRGLSS